MYPRSLTPGRVHIRTVGTGGRGAEARRRTRPAAAARGTGELPGVSYEEVSYEGYGPGGVAVYIEAMTDNKNRTTAEIRHVFGKYGGNMAASGAVAFQFSKKGYLAVEKNAASEDQLMELALEAGAEDFRADDSELFEITTDPGSFEAIKAKLEAKNVPLQTAELQMTPQNMVAVEDKAPSLIKLLEMLEDNDDVQKVWSSGDIDDQYLQDA